MIQKKLVDSVQIYNRFEKSAKFQGYFEQRETTNFDSLNYNLRQAEKDTCAYYQQYLVKFMEKEYLVFKEQPKKINLAQEIKCAK